MSTAYFNEPDKGKAAWLRELQKAGVIADGEVDERGIEQVEPADLVGFTQCHFFAGIGVWSYALRLAGWPDDRPVWTGSCPCQPFSTAGKREGVNDERHLWPEWFRLIEACNPNVIFGEQVSSAIRGVAAEDANLPVMQGRQALLRVLHELKRGTTRNLQGLRSGKRAHSQAVASGSGEGSIQVMAEREAGIRIGNPSPLQGEEERIALRTELGRDSGQDRPWILRGHGDSVRSYQASLLECSFAGPDRPVEGVHGREHPGDSLLFECDGERLGIAESRGDGQCTPRAAYKAQQRINRVFNGCFKEEAQWSWLDTVRSDLEGAGYSCGSAVLGAHSAGAPHIRQRLFFVADTEHDGLTSADGLREATEPSRQTGQNSQRKLAGSGDTGELADPNSARCEGNGSEQVFSGRTGIGQDERTSGPSATGELGNASSEGLSQRERDGRIQPSAMESREGQAAVSGSHINFWSDAEWLPCRDGKFRPVERAPLGLASGIADDLGLVRLPSGEDVFFPLMQKGKQRVLRLKGYGDAICAETAKEFIAAYQEVERP